MKAQELFGVGVRLIGVWMIVRCTEYVYTAFSLKFIFGINDDGTNSPKGMLSFAAFYLGLALCFLLAPNYLTAWTYSQDSTEKLTQNRDEESD